MTRLFALGLLLEAMGHQWLVPVGASLLNAPHNPRAVQYVSSTSSSSSSIAKVPPPKPMGPGAAADWDRMPSLFSDEEELYDRYAACLAATEGLRRIRDRDLADLFQTTQNSVALGEPVLPPEEQARRRKRIVQSYIQNSGKVLRAMGMPVKQFNELGREIAQSEKLKGRIMEQAYLYRMAATINMDRSHFIDSDDNEVGSSVSGKVASFHRDKVQLFCQSMSEIEKLRAGQVERLMRSLQVESFPENINISDPNLLPFLSPRVRAVVEAFPLQAEAIVKKHGLDSEEFNQMLKATKTNPIFRWKIQKQLRIGDIHPAAATGRGERS
eukprot:CAMPEP_0168736340 /NCGR_PEP_ID=MMETSP0724-20121128/9810_1 /TAXON_ID=265536 /ORGANISM="Amphiprora sp., Strain CCMP467" /LENGTH=326 /DNA_ID=CAMNT_0008783535 /DNA_START=42 /DNA_END=1023 /DNA_ORIENTATION=+